jgi:hypothetical protein
MVISIVFSFASVTFRILILCERKINIEKDMLLKDKNQSKRTIKMDLNNFDKTLLRDVIGKKENNEKSYLFYQELLGHLWEIPPRYRHGKTFPYIKTINISIVEESFILKIVLVKSVSTIRFCENYRQVLASKSKKK